MLAATIWNADMTPEQFSFWLKIMSVSIPLLSLLLLLPKSKCKHDWEDEGGAYSVSWFRCRRCKKTRLMKYVNKPDGSLVIDDDGKE